jgi:hypothetical protein
MTRGSVRKEEHDPHSVVILDPRSVILGPHSVVILDPRSVVILDPHSVVILGLDPRIAISVHKAQLPDDNGATDGRVKPDHDAPDHDAGGVVTASSDPIHDVGGAATAWNHDGFMEQRHRCP